MLTNVLIVSAGSLTNPVSVDVPPALRSSIVEASALLSVAGECVETNARLGLEADYQRREGRFWAATLQAQSLWGSQIDLSEVQFEDEQKSRCEKNHVLAILSSIEDKLDLEESLFRKYTYGIEIGLWIGPLKLCRETVEKAKPAVDRFSGKEIISIILANHARIKFAQITSRSINYKLPVRLFDKIIMEANVNEPILGGIFQISGPDEATLERARAAASEGC